MHAPDGPTIETRRLLLRPFAVADAEAVVAIQQNWNVMRMLRAATYPVTLAATRAWLASHAAERAEGAAHRFAIVSAGEVIGCVDVDEIAGGRGELGYWLAESAWGQGFATEAAGALVDLAFGPVGLTGLDSGHAADNPTSGKVLTKVGFEYAGDVVKWSNPRGGEIVQKTYRLEAPSHP